MAVLTKLHIAPQLLTQKAIEFLEGARAGKPKEELAALFVGLNEAVAPTMAALAADAKAKGITV